MITQAINAAPQVIGLGIDDQSIPPPIVTPEARPTHLAHTFFYAQTGPTDIIMSGGSDLMNTYGSDTFDARKKWFNHQTKLVQSILKQGNVVMSQRVVPDDAPPPATLRISLDVLETGITQYQRNEDGSFVTDQAGAKVPVTGATTSLAGFQTRFVVTAIPVDQATSVSTFGVGEITAGFQTDGVLNNTSKLYPIIDLNTSFIGEYGNNAGIRLWAPTTKTVIGMDSRLLKDPKVYPYYISVVRRPDASSTPTLVKTMYGETYIPISFKEGSIDPNSDSLLFMGDKFLDAYRDLDTANATPIYGDFGGCHVYTENIETLLNKFYTAEVASNPSFSDFKGSPDEHHLFNFIGGVTSNGVPYNTYQFTVGDATTVRLTPSVNIFASGGGDGTMNDANFAKLVSKEVKRYADPTDVIQDDAQYPQSIIYDSGFPLATKYDMIQVISLRKDTAIVLSTFDTSGPPLSASSEASLAVALRTRLQMYPESEYFGTGVARGMIQGRCGKLISDQYRGYLPLTIEVASKSAAYMGAGTGIWKTSFNFDHGENAKITMFKNVNVTWTPVAARQIDWSNGLNWVMHFDRRTLCFPAMRSIYQYDKSVLTSWFTVLACVELQKLGMQIHREFQGVSSMTNLQLKEAVEKSAKEKILGKFDSRFRIEPEVIFTNADLNNGYSWTLYWNLYAPNMKTVMQLAVIARRLDSLQTNAG